MSKLAALAAARKRKEVAGGASAPTVASEITCPHDEQRSISVSLLDTLASSGEVQGAPQSRNSRLPLRQGNRIVNRIPEQEKPPTHVGAEQLPSRPGTQSLGWENLSAEPSPVDLRAKPSTFASIIVGEASIRRAATPSHRSQNVDLMSLFGPDLTEVYGFTDPSPDDAVLNAQSAAKG
jgi:elongation factor 1 alpha-like protein